MPVAVLGLVFFVAMVALCSPWAWQRRALDRVRVAAAIVGVLSVFYLVWAELFEVGAICLWCTAVHVCTVVLLGLVLWTVSSPISHAPTRRQRGVAAPEKPAGRCVVLTNTATSSSTTSLRIISCMTEAHMVSGSSDETTAARRDRRSPISASRRSTNPSV